jgi:Lrp/AsnC family leucine-responsive transcriptional regulator
MPEKLDKTDKLILSRLQRDARVTNAELAEEINLSPTPCLRRVRRLEESGVIKGYSTVVDRQKLGLDVSALVFIQLDRKSAENAEIFESAVSGLTHVTECFVVSGEYDYMLHVVSESLKHYERFLKKDLASIAPVAKIDTTIILNEIVSGQPLPMPV